MVYKHAYLNTLLLLHSAFMFSMVKMPLKGEVGGYALNSHGNYIVDHGKSLKNQGILFLNFCGNPDIDKSTKILYAGSYQHLLCKINPSPVSHDFVVCPSCLLCSQLRKFSPISV